MNSEKRLKLNPSPGITKGFLSLSLGQGFVFGETKKKKKKGLALLYSDHSDKGEVCDLN